ncbi:MAG: glycosyltransferase [Prevotellaceae bacterium]|jgi:glycosyltransferase involved in cell wall biosynthesis|nr:glycosyltransferase [Prevotellaceae bacterium]
MKIALFSDAYPPVMDGVALAVRNNALWLNKIAGSVKVITPYHPKQGPDEDGFLIERFASIPAFKRPPYRIGLPFIDGSFLSMFRRLNFDIVHAHSPFSTGKLALLKAKQLQIPLAASFHSKFRDDFMQVFKNKYIVNKIVKNIIRFYEQADEVWIPQASVEQTIREYGYKGKLEVVSNGVDFTPKDKDVHLKKTAKLDLGISCRKPMLLFVGQHIWEKNVKFLLESLAELKDFDYQAYFVGEGYAKNDMEKLTHTLTINSKISFMGVVRDRSILNKLFLAADLFLFPSKYDNAPLVLREAAASQTPGLLLENSTAAEVITHNVNGFLSPEDTKAYAVAIKNALSNENYLNIADNACASLCRSWESIAYEITDRYRALIARKSRKYIHSPSPLTN